MDFKQLLQKYKKQLVIGTAVILFVVMGFVVYKKLFKTTPPRNNFVVAMPNDIVGYDPGNKDHTQSAQGDRLFYCIHSTLVSTNENGDVLPQVATSWFKVENEDAVVFTLRDDVLFHNGKKLTAKDVKFSFERAKGKQHDEYENIKSVEELEGGTKVKLNLKAFPAFAYESIAKQRIISQEAVKQDQTKDQLEGLKVGSGPYQLVSWDSSEKVINLKLFDKYFDKEKIKNSQKEIVFKTISNQDTALLQLSAGTVDAVLDFPVNKVADAKKQKDITVVENAAVKCSYLMMNNQKVELEKRKLIAQALDIKKIITQLELPVKPLKTFIPEGEKGHNTNISYAYNTNTQEVKNQVSQLPNKQIKFGFSAKETPEVANKIKEQLQEVGFEVTLDIPEFNTFKTNLKKGDYDIFFMSDMHEMAYGHKVLTDYMTPKNEGDSTQGTWAHISGDQTLKDLLEQSQTNIDLGTYVQKIQQIQTHLDQKKYVVPFYQQNIYFLTSKKVQGLKCDLFTRTDFTKVQLIK
ncbi:ABC-type peptide/nickel transport system, substrate-binding protein [Maize bushy stunt phytoplasma]|uniref:ABC-type peptide/nickel transport system, substrate-binding protein n=1 Tax=Maize bushy stunt phytoplasma TaxID=202462 RepID=A0ABN4S1C9_9MOLU|nr:ABC transporter substrate-binding protein [Maize bushy stunt phytoplasma]AOF54903.1 ABC-type peptide/nickel transport system, substrate-binding protein [Maize bushy stunt phytoplasma]